MRFSTFFFSSGVGCLAAFGKEPGMFRLRTLTGCLVLWLTSVNSWGDTTFPYVAYVDAPQTFARSGPGQQHYPTQQLPQGHAVEVYRHDSDGWCAVRPPEGSFCWIPAHEIHRQSATKAVVAVQTTVARVGSAISPARNAVQVMLRRDEEVQISPAGPNDDPRWLRMAPPAGEFRWIAATGLSRTPPVEGTRGVQLASGWMRQRSTTGIQTVANESADAFAHLLQSAPGSQPPYQATQPTPPLPGQVNHDPNAVQVVAGSPAAVELARSDSLAPPALLESSTPLPGTAALDSRVSTTPRIRFGNSPDVLGPGSKRIQELQLRLSQTIVKPKEEWQFQQLQAEIAALLEKSDSVAERDHLRNLLDRIARFQQVQLGTPTQSSPEEALAKSTNEDGNFTGKSEKVRELVESDLANNDPFEGKAVDPNGPRYDAVGRLKPVVSQSDGAPRFALVDDRGEVVSFVTPSPDLNLRPYVGMLIGVNGSRGFIPEYRKAHVTAGRVMPIEDRIRR
jgi:uncharacterized protein YgiM (DUF1202 family)